jgi:hypothetical protein
LGVADAFFRFDFGVDVGLGDGVGDAFFCFRWAVGDGVGVAFFFRCLCVGVGVGAGSKTFLIFVPNDSSAASVGAAQSKIARNKQQRSVALENANFVGRFCETPIAPASDTDALQFMPSSAEGLFLVGDNH